MLAVADPMYHNSGDLSDREGYDFEQVKAIAKVQVKCAERAHALIVDCVFLYSLRRCCTSQGSRSAGRHAGCIGT